MKRVDTDPYHKFKFYIKAQVLELYQENFYIINGYVARPPPPPT